MFFICVGFWFVIVSLFVFSEFVGGEIMLLQEIVEMCIDVEGVVGSWCEDCQEICDVGEEVV